MGFGKHFPPVCDEVDKMIDEGTPPDLVVDLTFRGLSTDVIQSLASNLGLPTVAATSAAEGELKYFKYCLFFSYILSIRAWADLSSNQQKYLLQVRPPGDILPDVIRSLVENSKISNVAILYDATFGRGLLFTVEET